MFKNYFGLTDTGRQRLINEDRFIAEELSDELILAAVIDGVGGYEGGEVAASLAREAIYNVLQQKAGDVVTALKNALAAANKAIFEEKFSSKQYSRMACVVTVVVADLRKNKFFYAHVGDTRLYLMRNNSLTKITNDHSFVGFLEDSGRIDETAAMHHPKRNEINKALGFDVDIFQSDYIETGESLFLPGDILLLCSDGLTDLVNKSIITDIVTNPKSLPEKAKALISAANDAGGKDNITVVLVKNK